MLLDETHIPGLIFSGGIMSRGIREKATVAAERNDPRASHGHYGCPAVFKNNTFYAKKDSNNA